MPPEDDVELLDELLLLELEELLELDELVLLLEELALEELLLVLLLSLTTGSGLLPPFDDPPPQADNINATETLAPTSLILLENNILYLTSRINFTIFLYSQCNYNIESPSVFISLWR